MDDYKPSELVQDLKVKAHVTEGGVDVANYCRDRREAIARAANKLIDYEVDELSIREMFDLPADGKSLFDALADWQQDMVAGGVRLQNAVHNVLAERLYENGRKDGGVAVKFLMRLSMLANEAGLLGYSKENPVVAEAIAALGDPAQPNTNEDVAAVIYQPPCRPTGKYPDHDDGERPFMFGR